LVVTSVQFVKILVSVRCK